MSTRLAMPRRFLITLAVLWVGGCIAGFVHAQQQNIPAQVALAVIPALLAEAGLYVTLAFEEMRARWRRWALILLAPVPYVMYSGPCQVFDVRSALAIAAAAGLAASWYRVFRRCAAADIGFVALMASPLVFKAFGLVYERPHPEVRLEVLGQLMWIRIGIITILHDRPERGINFGFLPTRREWKSGLLWFIAAMAAVLALTPVGGFAEFVWPRAAWWRVMLAAAATFAGILWVVALSEEFFFRGLLQQWLERWSRSRTAGLLVASALFGAAHLGFRRFPNYEFALLAAVAGVFYGLAFRHGGGIRAAMVTHALLVTTWRSLFR